MDTKGLIGVGFLLFVAVFGLFMLAPVVDHNSSVQHNEPTSATVTGIDIAERTDDGDREYRPVITYEYTVDGRTYTSENVYPGQFARWHGSESTAEAVTDRYRMGSDTTRSGESVTAYYNPDSPGEAYLHNPGWPDAWYLPAGAAVVLLVGGLLLVRKGFRRWRQRTLIRDTPTEQARSLSIGPSEITGTAVPAGDGPMRAPFSAEECVLAEYEIEEYDTSGDDSDWEQIDSGVVFRPFQVDDGTGQVLVVPHEEATYDLEPEDWSTTYVDSGQRGPEPVRQFVSDRADLEFPADSSGQSNDRKYRQNLIKPGESVYVFGTVKPRDGEAVSGDNADRLVIEKVTDDSMRELMFLVSDDAESDLIERRRWALWRAPVGGFFLVVGFVMLLLMFAPMLGVEVPRVFDGLIESVS